MVEIIFTIVFHILLILVLSGGHNNLNLAAEYQGKAVATGGLLQTGEARPVAPLVQFPTKGIGFDLEHAKFASSDQPVTAGSVNMGNRGVNDSRFGGATDLRQVWQETGEIL